MTATVYGCMYAHHTNMKKHAQNQKWTLQQRHGLVKQTTCVVPFIAMWYSNSLTCYIGLFFLFFPASCDVACSLTWKWKWKMCELTRAVQLKSMKEIWRKITQVIPNTKSIWAIHQEDNQVHVYLILVRAWDSNPSSFLTYFKKLQVIIHV